MSTVRILISHHAEVRPMDLLTDANHEYSNVTEEQLLTTFLDERENYPTWVHFRLTAHDGSAVQAVGPLMNLWRRRRGKFILQFWPKDMQDIHWEATERLRKDEVLLALLDYFRGGTAWYDSREWKEVNDSKGWFPRLLSKFAWFQMLLNRFA